MKFLKKYKIFETNDIPNDLTQLLKNEINFIVYKKKKKNTNTNNYKLIYVKDINGIYNETKIIQGKKHIKTICKITMSNKDNIKASYDNIEHNNNIISNIKIILNDNLIYDMDNNNFSLTLFIDKIKDVYTAYLKKEWKIKYD